MTAQQPAAALFDMDGTLVDGEPLCARARDDLARELGVAAPVAANAVGRPDRLIVAEMLGENASAAAQREALAWLTARTAELYQQGIDLMPGAADLLKAVHDAKIPMALVTSTDRQIAKHAIATLGGHYFKATVCGDEVGGLTKPNPRPYTYAAKLLGVEPSRCLAVEDSDTGAKAAVRAGCTVLVVPPPGVDVPPGPRRVFLDSLEDVTVQYLTALMTLRDPTRA